MNADPSQRAPSRALSRLGQHFRRWFDSSLAAPEGPSDRIDWLGCLPFVLMHAACLLVIWAGFSWFALALAVALYVGRMFLITGFYHRYFSHRTFRTSRVVQFLAAWCGCMAVQRSPVWWASHHRIHHQLSDKPGDPHSPGMVGFFMSHAGWFLTRRHFPTVERTVRDWKKFPELRWLDRYDVVPAVMLAVMLTLGGWILGRLVPSLGTSGFQLLVWGFFISTAAVYHATFAINSLSHMFGSRRFATTDQSRNNLLLAILTLGEGWHNNHHHYPVSVRQGFYWWEIDVTYWILRLMSCCGLVWDLRPVPGHVLREKRLKP